MLKRPDSSFLMTALILNSPRERCKNSFKSVTLKAFFSPIYSNLEDDSLLMVIPGISTSHFPFSIGFLFYTYYSSSSSFHIKFFGFVFFLEWLIFS